MPKLVQNVGQDRVIDALLPALGTNADVSLATSRLSLFGFEAIASSLEACAGSRVIVPRDATTLGLLGSEWDRPARNRLQAHAIARRLRAWLLERAEVRTAAGPVPAGVMIGRAASGEVAALSGTLSLTSDGLGITPSSELSLIQASGSAEESAVLVRWFDQQWAALARSAGVPTSLLDELNSLADARDPHSVYAAILYAVFGAEAATQDEDSILRSGTGIRDSAVWRKLYRFQRDGVLGVIRTMEKFGGCILADSVGLGKTFEALAVIKHHELRNDRVLVLCPKRLRDNWVLYKANDTRNILASDRLNYDVLNHTDLSREEGLSGDMNLEHVNWGNYDLVVIDESHNFRNKKTPKAEGETRYDRLMRRIIKAGVKTRVLMLSATPVNNRLADLRNQIAFATEGRDDALRSEGIDSINETTRLAQQQFNAWQKLAERDRTASRLVEMFGFDYFTLLDRLTIARSRKHIERYYGTAETGRFPDRLSPLNIRKGTDLKGEFPPIERINLEIRKLTLAAYQPLTYVLPHRQQAYDERYSVTVKEGKGQWRQQDREQSLVQLMRVNLLKRMESSVSSFALSVGRQLETVEAIIAKVDGGDEALEAYDDPDVSHLDLDDPMMESLVVGRRVKVHLGDMDRRRWRQDLVEDRDRLRRLHDDAARVEPVRDEKLQALREFIAQKVQTPFNPNNRKVLVFSAFADTARYLYEQLAPWILETHGLHSALVTGADGNRTTSHRIRRDLGSILGAFAPRARERPVSLGDEGDLEFIFATDCISEGQNLQDCDCVVNYDIHWNPVRIIQRFGRVDRLGSANQRIQLVNFWPNVELEVYIQLEQRVSGRMTLLDISATGEENLIQAQSGDEMNDLAYRRTQLLKLQDQVIDLDDLSAGLSISDLTLSDFRVDLARQAALRPGSVERTALGAFAVTRTHEADIPPGAIFCLRAVGSAAERARAEGYPLAPHYLVQVSQEGTVVLGHLQAKRILDRLRRTCAGQDSPDRVAVERFESLTAHGVNMSEPCDWLTTAISSISGVQDARVIASLFAPGGTAAGLEGVSSSEFEVVAFISVIEG